MKQTLAMIAVVLATGASSSFNAASDDNVFKEFGEDASDLGKHIGKAGKDVGKQLGKTGKEIGSDISKRAKDVGKAFSGD